MHGFGPIRQAVVLAGGLGTRLGPLTAGRPKPLLDVGGWPFLDWVVANLASHGVERIVLTIGYQAGAFDAWLERRGRLAEEVRAGTRSSSDPGALGAGVRIETFVEEEPLGTGGALPLLAPRLDEVFLLLNGDTMFDAPLDALGALRTETSAAGAVALRAVDNVGRYGEAMLEGRNVVAINEKGRIGPGLINGGVYAFTRDAVAGLSSPCSIELDLLPALAASGRLVGLPSDGFFIDIGVPESYEEAQTSVPTWWSRRNG